MVKVIFTLLVLNCSLLYSQVHLEWVARYNGPSGWSEYARAMALDSMGNVYVAGSDQESPSGILILKYNSMGQLIWLRRYTGHPGAGARKMAVDPQGNIYIGGITGLPISYLLIKYNSSGVFQWAKSHRGTGAGSHNLKDIIVDAQGSVNIVVTGTVNNIGTGSDVATVKYNANGDSLWVRNYKPTGNTEEGSSAIDNGDLRTYGITGVAVIALRDYLTLSYDLNGNLRWAQVWNGPGGNRWDVAYDIALDRNGNSYVTGYAEMDTNYNDEDIATLKYDSNGNLKWVRFYDGPAVLYSYDRGYFIKTDPFDNVIVSGYDASGDYCTIKYDSLGNLLWVRIYNGAQNLYDTPTDLGVDKFGSVYVTGTSNETSHLYKITTIKYDKNGNQMWLRKYPDYDTISSPSQMIVDKNLNVYICGEISVAGGSKDIIVLKYSQPTGVTPINNEVPQSYKLYQNYPNPFNPVTFIKFQIANLSNVRLVIYDVVGRELLTLVNEQLKAGLYEVEFDGTNYPSGVYFYRLISEDVNNVIYDDTRRMVLLK